MYQQKHTKKQLILFRCINKLALTKCLEVKLICEAILINLVKYFNQISSYIWCKSFEYLKKFIEILDYKSCRDVFKILLDVVKHLSNKNNSKLPELSANEVDLPSNDTKIEALYDVILINFSIRIDQLKRVSIFFLRLSNFCLIVIYIFYQVI